jgi:hypothetical protein
MRFEWLDPENEAGLREWDAFQVRSVRGHYCQLSTWLRSFRAYGFGFSVLVARREQEGPVVGGIGLLRAGRGSFGILGAPVGPIVEVGAEDAARPILEAVLEAAAREGVFLVQFQFPCSQEAALPAVLPALDLPQGVAHHPGRKFPAGAAPNQMLWIPFPEGEGEAWRESLLAQFGYQARRRVRRSECQGLEAREACGEQEIREAYALIEENGRLRRYSVRAWRDFGPVAGEQIARGQAVMLLALLGGRAVGAWYGILAGRRCSYLMGGMRRVDPKLEVGYFLHWRAMQLAKQRGLLGYDLTSGGPPGVMQFKMGFRPQRISFLPPEYYVLSRWRCAVFFTVSPWLRRHKALVGRVLSATTRWRRDR